MRQGQHLEDAISLLAGRNFTPRKNQKFHIKQTINNSTDQVKRNRLWNHAKKLLIGVVMLIIFLSFVNPLSAQGTNTPPTAAPDIYATALNTPFNLVPGVLDNDTDLDGDPLSMVSFTQPENGTLTESGGILTYTPDAAFEGLDTFIYTVSDGTDNSIGKGFIEVGSPDIDLLSINIADTVSNGVPAAGAGNIEVPGAVDVYIFDANAGDEIIINTLVGNPVLLVSQLEAPDNTVVFSGSIGDYQVVLPQTGTYTLTINGRSINNTGTYSFELLEVPSSPEQFVIAIGDTVSNGVPAAGAGNIEVPGAIDVYSFDANAGDEIIINTLVGNPVLLVSRLEAPDNTVVFSGSIGDYQVVLPQTGTYTITVNGRGIDDTATYSFELLYVPAPENFVINIGDTVSNGVPTAGAGNIEVPGAVDIYSIDANVGDSVIFDWQSGSNVFIVWELLAPDNTVLFTGSLADHHVIMPQSGTYTLTVSGRSEDDFGTYSFELSLAPPPENFVINIGDTVSNGVPVAGAGNIEAPGAVDIYSLDATVGQEVIFDWQSGSNVFIVWELLAPDNTVLFSGSLADYQVLLPQSGTYTLIVRGRGVADFGTYGFELISVPSSADQFTISIGDAVSDGVPAAGAGNLEQEGALDIYSFDAVVGQEVIFDHQAGNNVLLGWRLEAPDNTVLFDSVFADYQLTLNQTGTYRLIVRGNRIDDFGTYGFQVVAVPPVQVFAINIGDTVSDGIPDIGAGNLETQGAIDIYTFDAVAGQELDFDWLSGSPTIFQWQVLAPDGAELFSDHVSDQLILLNQTGTYTIIVDGAGVASFGLYSFSVLEFNSNPLATDDDATTDEDVAVTIDVLLNDTDIDGDSLSVESVTQGSNGIVSNNGSDVTYTPNLNFNGSDSFTYVVNDGNGGSDTATVSVTILPVNDDPIAVDDTASTDEDVAVTIDVLLNDTDIDGDSLSVESVTQGSNGIVSNNGSDVTYTPNANFNGSDSFTYVVNDGNGGSDTATVSVTILPVNDDPIAVDDTASTDEDVPVAIDVLLNDTDIDGDSLSVESVTQGSNGIVSNNGSDVTYTPNLNFNGSDSFTYVVNDGNGGSDTATVFVSVSTVNNAPDAVDDMVNTDEDVAIIILALANDIDSDGDILSVDSVGMPANGTNQINPDNSIMYVPNLNFHGSDSFTYTISDGYGGTDSATVFITVNPINDAPIALDDVYQTNQGSGLIVDVAIGVLANDNDIDGNTLTAVLSTNPTNGSLVLNADGSFTYQPDTGFNGIDSFTYVANDGLADSNLASVTMSVLADTLPTIAPILDQHSDDCGIDQVSLQASAQDAEGVVRYDDGGTLPAGLSIDPISGLILGIISDSTSANSPYNVTITVIDSIGQTAQTSFLWVIESCNIETPTPEGTQVPTPPSGCAIVGFELWNADTDTLMGALTEGAVFDLSAIHTANLNIVAVTDSTSLTRVEFQLSGTRNYVDTEHSAPYAMFGDDGNGNYAGEQLSAGSYTLHTSAYISDLLCATATVNFTLLDPFDTTAEPTPELPPVAVTQFLLVNADNDTIIGIITDGDVIDTDTIGTRNLNIIVETIGAESVVVTGDFSRNENSAPYTVAGDENGDYYGLILSNGSYTITATAYSNDYGQGTASVPLTINFTVIGN